MTVAAIFVTAIAVVMKTTLSTSICDVRSITFIVLVRYARMFHMNVSFGMMYDFNSSEQRISHKESKLNLYVLKPGLYVMCVST